MLKKEVTFKRGEIYIANLNPFVGSEQGGTRPVIILQNNIGNYFSPTLVVAPLTSKVKYKKKLPTHYIIQDDEELTAESLVLLEQVKTIDKQRVLRYVGRVSDEDMKGIEKALKVSLGMDIPTEIEAP